MAYNSYPSYTTYTPMQQTYTPVQSGIIWVQGEAGAKSFLVAPNQTVPLWSSEDQVIYLKSADASGLPSMKVLDYTIRDQTASNAPVSASAPAVDYATKNDLKAISEQIDDLRDELESLTYRRPKRKDDGDE